MGSVDDNSLAGRLQLLRKLQAQAAEARKAGDFDKADKIKSQIREVTAEPFDRRIRALDEPSEELAEPDFNQGIGNYKEPEQISPGKLEARALQDRALRENLPPPKELDRKSPPGGPAREAVKQVPPVKPVIGAKETNWPQKGLANRTLVKGKDLLGDLSKLAKKAALSTAKKIAMTFFGSTYGPIIIGVVFGLIILIILIAIFWGSIMGMIGKVSPTGTTFTHPADPISDKDWVRKVLLYSGDQDATKMLTEETLNQIKFDLEKIKTTTGYEDKAADIDRVLAQIETFRASKNQEQGQQLINDLKALINKIWDVSVLPSDIVTAKPIDNPTSYNRTPHYGTAGHSCKDYPSDCNIAHRTFMQYKKDTCDATDIQVTNGTPVHAAFGGKVIKDLSENNSRVANVWIELEQGGNKYTAVYAHMQSNSVSNGQSVNAGDVIGSVGQGHLHFELAVNDRCVVATPADIEVAKANGTTIGLFILTKMLAVLHI